MGVTVFGELRREVKFKGGRKQNCVDLIVLLWQHLALFLENETATHSSILAWRIP